MLCGVRRGRGLSSAVERREPCAGQTCLPRDGRNTSGESEPSNAVGPVKVTGVCLVDEFMDLSRVRPYPRAALDNRFNAIYAEYLFPKRGDRHR